MRETITELVRRFSCRVWDYRTSWVRFRYDVDNTMPVSCNLTVTWRCAQLYTEFVRSLTPISGDKYVGHEVTFLASLHVGSEVRNWYAFRVSPDYNFTDCGVLSDGCI